MKALRLFLLLIALSCMSFQAAAERIKDLASVAGVRSNQLVGYGLVVGLDGSGDQTQQTPFTVQSLKSMLSKFGITMPANINPQLKNVAAVSIMAELPPFAKPGQRIDVTVSSIGNAKSLRGGSLLMAPLKAANGDTYALAQGNLIVSGFGAAADGSKVTVNVPSTGRIPNGAHIERAVPSSFNSGAHLTLNLNTPDFTTANRLAKAVNLKLGDGTASALDGSSVQILAPRNSSQRVAFASVLENIQVEPGSASARIIINSRTGTVVIGNHVSVQPAAVSHGSLTVKIASNLEISQPNAFAGGETAAVGNAQIDVEQEPSKMFLFDPGVSLDEIVRAVNRVGAAPGDLVAILEALKEAGALRAELIVI
jgi:flagellar P-ring protein precursor FlgI